MNIKDLRMNKLTLASSLIFLLITPSLMANTPTEALTITVDKLISVAQNNETTSEVKKVELSTIINSDLDFEAMSRRIVSKPWKATTAEQKAEFKILFSDIVVNTYFSLLENYSGEKVSYLKEQLKGTKYAIVDTQIVTGKNKIPVRYRLIKSADSWKVYDFVPEGISIVTTYKKNYATILRKEKMVGLLDFMKQKAKAKLNND